jgi:cytochrome b pre-mRNA-processing protein 3
MVLALRALREWPAPADEVAKDLTDAFFRDMDASLREMGVGDTVVPKRMKKIAESFYGRAHAYDGPLNGEDEAELAVALGRNVYGSEAPATSLARYAFAAARGFRTGDLDSLLTAGPTFPDPETFAQGGTR